MRQKTFENRAISCTFSLSATLLALSLASSAFARLDAPPQPEPLDDILYMEAMEKSGALTLSDPVKSIPPVIDEDDFIVFGYLQNANILFHVRWHALTHIGVQFTVFDSDGNFTNLPGSWNNRSNLVKAGGPAEAAGTKVIMVLNSFDDEMPSGGNPDGGAIYQVFTTPSKRTNLVNNVVDAMVNDPGNYSHGVNIDVEFSWNTEVRDGLVEFFAELRQAFDAAGLVDHEISVYTNPTFSSTLWNFDPVDGITPHIDYMIFSGYDWGTGSTPVAVSRMPQLINQAQNYINNGLPPEKLVIAYSTYGRTYPGTDQYLSAGTGSSSTGRGFTHGLFDTTIRRSQVPDPISDPSYTPQYSTNGESAWYTFESGGDDYTVVWDSEESLEYKFRQALSFGHGSSDERGRRLRGVSIWSLRWLAETSSIDMRTGNTVGRTRTYPHVYQLFQELFSPVGQKEFFLEPFAGIDPRWRNPSEAPDSNNHGAISVTRVNTPGGSGAAENSVTAAQLVIPFTGATGNRAVFAHEILAHPDFPAIRDYHSALGHVPRASTIRSRVHTTAAHGNYSVRMLAIDENGEIEASPAFSLGSAGWQTLEWDLFDDSATTPFTTTEPGFSSGDGVVDSAGGRTRDIGFFGFVVEGTGVETVTITFDYITYELADPHGKDYVINEFTYLPSTGEYVEIHGEPGVIPAGTELVVYNSADGSILNTFDLSGQTIGAGGLFVVGDSGVSNVDFSTGFTSGGEFPNTIPSAIQLRNSNTGHVYDSLVWRAYGGLGDLVRRQTWGVTGFGPTSWTGQIGNGGYSIGRYPDGANTGNNFRDFSVMQPSPGSSNAGAIASLPVSYNFATTPAPLFFAFNWVNAGITSSPPGSTPPANALRVADSTGGNIAFIGDAALGGGGAGYSASGEMYIQPAAAGSQSVAVGICGTLGSNFFSAISAGSAYETGYWITYQNDGGASLRDGLDNHAGEFVFYHAVNNNQHPYIVEELGRVALASISGLNEGDWGAFVLSVDPTNDRLYASMGGAVLYDDSIPTDGPTAGAFQIGHRMGTTGGSDGAFVANLTLDEPIALEDTTPPTSQIVSPTSGLFVGDEVSFTFTSSDDISGVKEVSLFVREPGSGSFVSADTTTPGNPLVFNVTTSGIHGFYTIAEDNADNVEPAPSEPEVTLVINAVPNGSISLPFDATDNTRTFPMEANLSVTITLVNAAGSGDITVSRSLDDSDASGVGINPDRLVGQSWSISATGTLTFDSATIVFQYDDALLGSELVESAIDTLFAVDGSQVTIYTGGDVGLDTGSKEITVTGVVEFSTWYAGNNSASVGEWINLMD